MQNFISLREYGIDRIYNMRDDSKIKDKSLRKILQYLDAVILQFMFVKFSITIIAVLSSGKEYFCMQPYTEADVSIAILDDRFTLHVKKRTIPRTKEIDFWVAL